MKTIAIGGEPGTGKTTLVKKFMESVDDWERVKPVKLLDALYSETLDTYVLGKYEEGEVFAGTDRLSMSVQPKAVEFIESTNSNVIFEGDRLFNGKFLDFLSKNTDLYAIYLETTQTVRNQRYIERGSNQSDKFLKGRETKYKNLKGNVGLSKFSETFTNENKKQQSQIIAKIKGFLNGIGEVVA